MNNANRRDIINKAKADGYQGSYVDLFRQAAQNPEMLVAESPEEKQAGLRPLHEAGRTDASMAFKDVPPNTPFNTVGMKAPIDIKKFDEQGHLVKSYDAVPPGIQSLDTGPNKGTVLETPARMQGGGFFDNVPYDKRGPRQEIVEPYFTGDDYNYRKALESGETPSPEDGHWGSVAGDGSNVVLKSKDHPTIKHEFIPTMMDPDWKMVGDPEGFFGEDNSMKYVPRMQKGDYVTPMRKKEFPSNAKRAKMVNYAKEIDMAGRLNKIGANTTNEELGRGSADRGTLPLVPNPELEKAMSNKRIKAQEGAFNIDPRLQNRIEAPQPQRTFLKPDNRSDRERAAADERFKADRKREEAIKRGVNPNTAFMTPPGLGADNEARAAYEYDNPSTSNIGQIAGGIGFLPIDRGLDIAMTAAGSAIRSGIDKFDANTLAALQKQSTSRLAEKVGTRDVDAYKNFKSEIDWKKWNPDTPNHPELMDEYKHIEYTTKNNGTWMKNADGSNFKGTPEQFVQENSSYFKEAFPDGAYNTYRGIPFGAGDPRQLDPGFGINKTVFSAGKELASSPYYTYTGNPQVWTPTSKRTIGMAPEGFVAPLYAKESKNSYRIISQGDQWGDLVIGGRSKQELAKKANSNRIAVDINNDKIANLPTTSNPAHDKAVKKNLVDDTKILDEKAQKQQWFADNYGIVNRKPSEVPDFEKILKARNNGPERGRIMTDEMGDIGLKAGVNDIRMFGLDDGGWSPHVNIHMNKPGNFLKSRVGNVGFFDMKSDDIFKAALPAVGAGYGLSERKRGGYKKAQEGSVVDFLLPALEANNPTQFADQQADSQAKLVTKSQQDLAAEKQKVKQVRENIIPTSEKLAKLNSEIDSSTMPWNEHYDAKKHWNKMTDEDLTKEEYIELEKEGKQKYPELFEAIPRGNLLKQRPDKYDAEDELYCTPYGCFAYNKAGAKDVPEYSGNYGFIEGVRSGQNPFQKVSADEAVPGDVGIMYEYEYKDYRNKAAGKALRPHHTTILSQKTDDPQIIDAYSAVNGRRLNFMEGTLKAETLKDEEGNEQEGRWDYYRYVGQTPEMQRRLGNAKQRQSYADRVTAALNEQAERSSKMQEDARTEAPGRIEPKGPIQIDNPLPEQKISDMPKQTKDRRKAKKSKAEKTPKTPSPAKLIRQQYAAKIKAARKGQ